MYIFIYMNIYVYNKHLFFHFWDRLNNLFSYRSLSMFFITPTNLNASLLSTLYSCQWKPLTWHILVLFLLPVTLQPVLLHIGITQLTVETLIHLEKIIPYTWHQNSTPLLLFFHYLRPSQSFCKTAWTCFILIITPCLIKNNSQLCIIKQFC